MNICNVQESLDKKWHSKHQVLNSADHATSRWSSVFLFLFVFAFFVCFVLLFLFSLEAIEAYKLHKLRE